MRVEVALCPLCGALQSNLFDRRIAQTQTITNRLCSECGLVYQSPRMSGSELEAFYQKEYRQLYQGDQEPTAKDLKVQSLPASSLLAFARVRNRVLVEPDEGSDKTTSGLYLPDTVREKQKVVGGYVIKTGPGYAVHEPGVSDEPWAAGKKKEVKYIPLQASQGDYAIFLKEAAVEIEFEGKKYLIVPHSAILALVRVELTEGEAES